MTPVLVTLCILLPAVIFAVGIDYWDRHRRTPPPNGWEAFMAGQMRHHRETDWLDQECRATWLLNAYHWNGLAIPDKADLPPVIREEFDRADELKERIGTE